MSLMGSSPILSDNLLLLILTHRAMRLVARSTQYPYNTRLGLALTRPNLALNISLSGLFREFNSQKNRKTE